MPEQTYPDQHFSLKPLNNLLEAFTPPQTSFDPDGSWTNTYKIYTLAPANPGHAGNLTVQRTAAESRITLTIHYEKFLRDGYEQHINGQIQCEKDTLCTPISWQFNARTNTPAGEPLPQTQISKEASAPFSTDGVYTFNWALYDAVQRLAREQTPTIEFTLFEHFEERKPNQRLALRKEAIVILNDQPTQLYAYEQTGEGIIPTVYWTNEQNRLLFVVAGLEAYVFNSVNP